MYSDTVFVHFTTRPNAESIVREMKLRRGDGLISGIFAVREGRYYDRCIQRYCSKYACASEKTSAVVFTTSVNEDYWYSHEYIDLTDAAVFPYDEAGRLLRDFEPDEEHWECSETIHCFCRRPAYPCGAWGD